MQYASDEGHDGHGMCCSVILLGVLIPVVMVKPGLFFLWFEPRNSVEEEWRSMYHLHPVIRMTLVHPAIQHPDLLRSDPMLPALQGLWEEMAIRGEITIEVLDKSMFPVWEDDFDTMAEEL